MKTILDYISEKLKDSFDVKKREVDTALGKATLIFIDNLIGTVFVSEYIVAPLRRARDCIKSVEEVANNILDINIVGFAKNADDAVLHILSGDVIIIFEESDKIIFCEAKGFVRRGVATPITEAVIKGPREGFTETFVDNIALIRRRVKNPDLKFEPIFAGKKSNTVVCLGYIKGIAPQNLVDSIRDTVKNLNYEFILDTNYVEDKLKAKKTLFDTIGYTEKPDEVVAKMMEGRIAILVDGTPFAITAPYFFLENFHAPDDYYLNKYFTNFTRMLRWVAFFLATFLPGIYVAVTTYHFQLIPSLFVYRLAVARAGVPFPASVEVIIMMIFFQIVKEAGLRLPQPIGTAMSIVAALILGDAAAGAGITSRVTILVIAVSTVSYFLVPKVYGAVAIWSVIIVLFASFYGLPGFFIGCLVFLTHLSGLKSCDYNYLFPLGTKKNYSFKDIVLRGNLDNISDKIINEDDLNEENK
ncbi:spore germination protein [Clostridium polyendosporum]|uniref:Spore germination protein n=1 Tax=Clostridium polyendosporum TaxID=69208 RepID=A0A919VMC9_9CLOT|nr:spore germination protein [Clostridium polyendosporum]GIM29463.1 spore germination protein [Clostridium polyendosporum]